MSLARQLLLLQLAVVLVAVAVAGAVAVRAADSRAKEDQRARVLSIAETLAVSGEVRAAFAQRDPSAVLQPLAERVRRDSDLGFVVFMSPDGVRFSHPNPARIGGRFVGTISPARAGRAFTETRTGTLGPSIRAVAPVRDGGRVAGLVAVGVLQEAIAQQVRRQLPGLLASLAIALVAGGLLSLLVARRVRRQTRGLDPDELAALYEHHDAVLHAIREGVVVVGPDDRLLLANAEAQRLLELGEDAVGRPVAEVVHDPSLLETLRGGAGPSEGLHVVGDRVLVSGRRTAARDGRDLATVTTLRDRTELEGLVRELATVRGLADALRAQAHESANELHTVVGLVELGRHDDAVAFATRRIGVTQDEVDFIQERVGDPALAALLLAKAAAGRERGVHVALSAASSLPEGAVPSEDLVTIVGNLIDNAFDALAGRGGGRIEVLLAVDGDVAVLEVRDDGDGIADADLGRIFDAGWSTKGDGARRGLGLALVSAAAARLGGAASARNDGGAVLTVRVPVRAETAARTR
ncbi:MAG TPA: sensor histidine kinase [Solirubrobacteraceae bacterium]|nr:sensor histidine kinase [Solirubrobacteraceae bacterium]